MIKSTAANSMKLHFRHLLVFQDSFSDSTTALNSAWVIAKLRELKLEYELIRQASAIARVHQSRLVVVNAWQGSACSTEELAENSHLYQKAEQSVKTQQKTYLHGRAKH